MELIASINYRSKRRFPTSISILIVVICNKSTIYNSNFYFFFFFERGEGKNHSIQNLTQFFSSFLNCLFKTECRSLGGQNCLASFPLFSLSRIGSKDTCLKESFFQRERETTFLPKTNFNRLSPSLSCRNSTHEYN